MMPSRALAVGVRAAALVEGRATCVQLAADAVALVKFRYHITFLTVVFGALIFAVEIAAQVVLDLLVLYVSFKGFYAVLLISTVVLVGGAHASSVVRGSLKAVWLR
jgi:hypothetical protein